MLAPWQATTSLRIPRQPVAGERKEKEVGERKAPMKWGFMVTGDKCEGLAEASRFYEQWFRVDWLLK